MDNKSSCSLHNHIFDYSNFIKLNSTIWLAKSQKVVKSYTPATVNCNLQEVK